MDKQEFSTCCGIAMSTLEIWLEQSWLVPDASGAEIRFTEIDVARVHLIRDLKGDLGVNDEGVGVVLHLVDQVHGLRRALTEMRNLEVTTKSANEP